MLYYNVMYIIMFQHSLGMAIVSTVNYVLGLGFGITLYTCRNWYMNCDLQQPISKNMHG